MPNKNTQMMTQHSAIVKTRNHDWPIRVVIELRNSRQRRPEKSSAGEDIGYLLNRRASRRKPDVFFAAASTSGLRLDARLDRRHLTVRGRGVFLGHFQEDLFERAVQIGAMAQLVQR